MSTFLRVERVPSQGKARARHFSFLLQVTVQFDEAAS